MSAKFERHLSEIDADRRAALIKLVKGAAFAAPVVATFAIGGSLSVTDAAYAANS